MFKYFSILPIGLIAASCGGSSNSNSISLPGNNGGGGSSSAQAGGSSISIGAGAPGTAGNSSAGAGSVDQSVIDMLTKGSCAGWNAQPESLPALLEFVVDTSASMSQTATGTGNSSKWTLTSQALKSAIDQLPASVGLGVLFFPNMNDQPNQTAQPVSVCIKTSALIPVALLGAAGSAQRTTVSNGINAARPAGYTPTNDAYDYALTNGLNTTTLPGKRFMVLITDGAPTLLKGCLGAPGTGGRNGGGGGNVASVDPQPIIDEIATAYAAGTETFIIGSPGSEVADNGGDERPWLSQAATAGGTATPGCSNTGPNYCHIDLTQTTDFGAALLQALNRIAGAVVSCSYDLPTPPTGQTLNLDNINVVYTTGSGAQSLVGRAINDNPACTDGWYLSGTQVQLCSNTCSQVKGDPMAGLQLFFGCQSVSVPK